MLETLGVRPVLCMPAGGETGEVALARLEHSDFEIAAVLTSSATAMYVEEREVDKPRTCIVEVPPGPMPARDVDAMYDHTLQVAIDAGICIVTGSPFEGHLADDVFGRLCRDLRAAGVRLVADLSRGQLAQVVEAGVNWIKVADDELERDGHATTDDEESLWRAASRMLDAAGADAVVVSRSSNPTFVTTRNARRVVSGPKVETVDARGSGDAMTAAIAAGLVLGWSEDELLATAVAAGAANAVHRSTATASRDTVAQLAALVTIETRSSISESTDATPTGESGVIDA
jgi:fructose-1-phosphate kinase PfkB-like protein